MNRRPNKLFPLALLALLLYPLAWLFLLPAVVIMLAACLYPTLSAIRLGFFDWSMGTPWADAKWVGWDSFEIVFTDSAMWRSLWTTLEFAAISVTATLIKVPHTV